MLMHVFTAAAPVAMMHPSVGGTTSAMRLSLFKLIYLFQGQDAVPVRGGSADRRFIQKYE